MVIFKVTLLDQQPLILKNRTLIVQVKRCLGIVWRFKENFSRESARVVAEGGGGLTGTNIKFVTRRKYIE